MARRTPSHPGAAPGPVARAAAGCRPLGGAVVRAAAFAAALAMAVTATAQGGGPVRDLRLEEATPGVQGYGVTAGPGNELVRFAIEVVSVEYDPATDQPLVLVRAGGDLIDEGGGVAAGMSGSPVYVGTSEGDALMGAIAYVFPSADHHLALVTPIAAMRRAWPTRSALAPPTLPGLGRAVAAATPVLVSGLSARATTLLQPLFAGSGLEPFPVQAGGTLPPSREPPFELAPGSAVSVQLTRGDVTIAAIGTATAVEGQRVLAFGHPLLALGASAYALAPAFVTAIVSSTVVPFKLASSGRTVLGTVEQDRPTALAARLGPGPAMIGVSVTVDTPGGSSSHRFEVADDERLYAPLVAAASYDLIERDLFRSVPGSAELAWDITLDGGRKLRLLERADSADDIAMAAARLAGAPLATLAHNAFKAPAVQDVKLNIRLSDERRSADVVEVVAENPTVGPGEALVAHVRLQPYRQEARVETLTIEVPDDLDGDVTLTFRGGDVTPEGQDHPPRPEDLPRSFPEFLDALRTRSQASDLVVEVPGDNGGTRRLARVTLPFVVSGSRTLHVTVDRGAGSGAAGGSGADAGAGKDAGNAPEPPAGSER